MMATRVLAFVASFILAWGCSYVEIPVKGTNGTDYLIGRSMELGDIANACTYNIELVPRKTGDKLSTPGDRQGKYGYLGVNNIFLDILSYAFEGMNEKGLTVSALEFRQGVYEQPQAGKPDVDMFQLTGFLLNSCDTVNCSLALLETVRVTDSILPSEHRSAGTFGLGLRWAITDVTGRSVVVEYLEANRVVYENTPRVMTNDPDLNWQWRNLNTYSNLSPNFPHQNDFLQVQTAVGPVPKAIGHGWNLFGLPGDSSPPSRFVNLFYLREYAVNVQSNSSRPKSLLRQGSSRPKSGQMAVSVDNAIVLGTDILDRVVIPMGTVAENKQEPFIDAYELTVYDVLKIPTSLRFIIRGHKNSQWREIDLTKLNFTQSMTWAIEDGTFGIKDMTADGTRTAPNADSIQV